MTSREEKLNNNLLIELFDNGETHLIKNYDKQNAHLTIFKEEDWTALCNYFWKMKEDMVIAIEEHKKNRSIEEQNLYFSLGYIWAEIEGMENPEIKKHFDYIRDIISHD